MRWERIVWGMGIGLALEGSPAGAQSQFSCGSTGADGALVVPSGQIVTRDAPDNGIFHFTTITVSGTLQFNRNTRFNPPVILLATGDVVVSNVVHVDGAGATSLTGASGGPGGFDGGTGGILEEPGAGHGAGAGGAGIGTLVGGNAGYGTDPPSTNHPTDGVPYGSPLLIPLVGGSGGGADSNPGGGGGLGGGGGGGAILLCSPTQVIVNGTVRALGGTGFSGSFTGSGNGSGGAIRILSPFVRGTGTLNVTGGGGWGGPGRIRIDVIDRSGLGQMRFIPSPSVVSLGSFMSVFPSTVPRLDIVHVAGNDIPPGTPSPLSFTLPLNAPANQPITVRATGFSGTVPVSVVVTPDSGNRIVVNTEIDADTPPAEITVNVDFPQNVTTRVHAWTR